MKPWAVLGDTCPPIVLLLGLLCVCSPASANPLADSWRGAGVGVCPSVTVPTGAAGGRFRRSIGLSPESFRQAMYAFRTQGRRGTVMHYIAKGLTAADIEAVVVHFGHDG